MSNVQRQLKELLAVPHEDLDIELKCWLDLSNSEHKADLAKALLALANHGGGFVLLGFKDENGTWTPAEDGPVDFAKIQDDVNGIVKNFAEPSFHCDVFLEQHPKTGRVHPIISVPSIQRMPVRSKKDGPDRKHVTANQYYIRAPGPQSRPIETAQEWDMLLHRCIVNAKDDLIDSIRAIIQGTVSTGVHTTAVENTKDRLKKFITESMTRRQVIIKKHRPEGGPEHCPHGGVIFSYAVDADFQSPTLDRLLEIMRSVKGHETEWPPWWVPTREEIKPYPYNGTVECSLISLNWNDPGYADFWRVSPLGLTFLWRGYEEDGTGKCQAGTIFDLTIPIWQVGATLLHASRFALALTGTEAMILYRAQWSGLSDRKLTPWARPNMFLLPIDRKAHQDAVSSEIVVSSGQISSQLPELVEQMTMPLYEIFDFYRPNKEMFRKELNMMVGRGH